MRIAIDGTRLCDKAGRCGAGIEHYTWSIVYHMIRQGLNHEFFLFTPPSLNRVKLNELIEGCENVKVVPSFGPKMSFLTRHAILPLRFFLQRPDVVFFPSGQMPLFWKRNGVITIHDMSIYDHPEWFPQGQDLSVKTIVPKSIERAEQIICVSKATETRLHELFPVANEKTRVVHEGVDQPTELLENLSDSTRFPFDRDYVLYLGTIEPRKNLAAAFQAFDAFLRSRPEQASQIRFIVAGKRGWKTKAIEAEFVRVNHAWKEIEPNGVIQMLGPVTEEEKWNLMARAGVLLFPSLDEGFGLPVLEAMSVGTPVITSNRGALPEVGGDAALYVDPTDIEQMSLSIAQCLLVPEGVKQLRVDGFRRASEFTWEKAAKETLKVLELANQKIPR